MEIKGIIEAIKTMDKPDATALKVEDVSQLDDVDMGYWRVIKEVLLEIDSFEIVEVDKNIEHSELNLSESKWLTELLKKVKLIDFKIRAAEPTLRESGKMSKLYFGAWLENLSPATPIDTALSKIEKNKLTMQVIISKLKKHLDRAIKFYAKGGWKNPHPDDLTLHYVP